MVHLVYCDNVSKELEILNGNKQWLLEVLWKKIPHSRVFKDEVLYLWKRGQKISKSHSN